MNDTNLDFRKKLKDLNTSENKEYVLEKVEILKRKFKIFKRLILSVFLFGLIVYFSSGYIVNLIITEDLIKNKTVTFLEKTFGGKAKITGKVIFANDPSPIISIENITLSKPVFPGYNELFTISKAQFKPSVGDLILGGLSFSDLKVNGVRLFINLDDPGLSNPENLLKKYLDSPFANNGFTISDIELSLLKKSPVRGSQDLIKRSFTLPRIEHDPADDKGRIISLSYLQKAIKETYYLDIIPSGSLFSSSDYTLKLYSNNVDLDIIGSLNNEGSFSGQFDISGKTKGVLYILASSFNLSPDVTEAIKRENDYTIKGKLNLSDNVELEDITISGDNLELKMNSSTSFKQNSSFTDIDIVISRFSYPDSFRKRSEMSAFSRVIDQEEDFEKRLSSFMLFSVGDDVNFNLSTKFENIELYGNKKGKARVDLSLDNNDFEIRRIQAVLPGRSALNISGKAKILKPEKELKGNLEISFFGNNLYELLQSVNALEENELGNLGRFVLKTKAQLYDRNIHFREAAFKINDDRAAGQVLVSYNKQFKASSAFNFTTINLDNYIDLNIFNRSEERLYDKGVASRLNFLRFIDSFFDQLDISISTKNLVSNENNFEEFSIYAQIFPGITNIKDLFFSSEFTGDFRGSAEIDITEFQPRGKIDMDFEEFDTDLIIYGNKVEANDDFSFDGKWNEKTFTFEELGELDGELKISVDRLRHENFLMYDFKTTIISDGEEIDIKDSRFEIFDSKVTFTGILTTEIPSFSFSFVASNMVLKDFLENTLGVKSVEGRFNISGGIRSKGYSIRQWIENLKGNINIISKSSRVKGFDFVGISTVLPKIQRKEQAGLVVQEYTKDEMITEFAPLSVGIPIISGRVIINDIYVKADRLRSSKVGGVVDLAKWNINLATLFNVITEDGYVVPLSLNISGPIGNHKRNWDYGGATRYWEQRFYGTGR
jgi:hypothetical protein